MLQIVEQLAACDDVLRTGADALVHDDADRDALLEHDLPFPSLRNLVRDAHRHDHSRRTEVVDVVIDRVGADARKIRDRHRAVERACVDDAFRQQTDLLEHQKTEKGHGGDRRIENGVDKGKYQKLKNLSI